MNRLGKFAMIFLVFIAPYSMADTLSQSAFYGTWKYTGSEGTLFCLFTQDNWTIKINDGEPMTVRILNWEYVDNSSIRTFEMFPNGFRITIQQLDGNIASTIIYINREKTHLIMPELSDDAVLTKQ
jgi:hypothetical protein